MEPPPTGSVIYYINRQGFTFMTTSPSEAEMLAALAREQGVSEDAVKTVLDALRRGGGTMAQFSHAEFGGMSQWSSGMTMVGDMFNDSLRAKLERHRRATVFLSPRSSD